MWKYTDNLALDQLIERLLADSQTVGLDTVEGSFDQCKKISFWVADQAKAAGFEASVVQLSDGPHDRNSADPRWEKQPTVYHYVPVIESYSVDLCARQFNSTAPYPDVRILTDLRQEWGSAYPADWTSPALWHPHMDAGGERFDL